MPTTNQFNGGIIGIYVDGTLVACTTSDTFEGNAQQIDASCKGSSLWGYFLQGTKNWTFTQEGRWQFDATYGIGDLIDLWIAGTEVTVKYSSDVSGDWYLYGQAIITNVGLTAPNNEAAGFSCTFSGRGALTKTTLT